ncbi:MAG: class I SAM-dependent methyltransferase [Anaerolineaceae bacterium]
MQTIDYNKIAQVYDDVRSGDVELINAFLARAALTPKTMVLDIGCGTGNYTHLFQKLTGCPTFGVDPSDGMLEKARAKGSEVVFKQGQGGKIPFEDASFDFIFMTDVIHHIPDIGQLFAEIRRVLRPGGKTCVVTQSHAQIEKRPIVRFFPGTAAADKARYPDIPEIQAAAGNNGLQVTMIETLGEDEKIELGADFQKLVEKKGFSMLHLIGEEEYERGLAALREELAKGPLPCRAAGSTLVWICRM